MMPTKTVFFGLTGSRYCGPWYRWPMALAFALRDRPRQPDAHTDVTSHGARCPAD